MVSLSLELIFGKRMILSVRLKKIIVEKKQNFNKYQESKLQTIVLVEQHHKANFKRYEISPL